MTTRKTTRYLLRLDDLCPTWDRARWRRVLALTAEYRIQPILAVLPDNRDPDLICGAEDPEFWPTVRELAGQGATIALHGYQHLSEHRGGGLLPLHEWTEFAGAPLETQRAWIAAGLALLHAQSLKPELWIAPRHGQDTNTLRALKETGINVVSDGFAPRPYRRGGVVWLPQQLWAAVEKGPGLWTILIHPNTATDAEIDQLAVFLHAHHQEFTSFPNALELFPPAPHYSPHIALGEWLQLTRIRLAKARKRRRTER
jgi:peptidoglycan/xylan/chitin deacetylase (PgdA/CDA1 family)